MGKRRATPVATDGSAAAAAAPRASPAKANGAGVRRGNGNLTNYQRKIICEFYQKSGGVMSQKDLAQWTKHEFNLKKTPAQSTISGILRRQHEFINMSSLELGIKKRRVVQHPVLDNALANWVIQCAHRGITVQGDTTKEKAKHFAKMLNIPEDEQPEFSNGWLHSFQLRHNFSFRKFNADHQQHHHAAHGANAAAGAGMTGTGTVFASGTTTGGNKRKVLQFTTMEALTQETDKYELANIFVMEELGMLYKLPPSHQLLEENALRGKKRFVAVLATNADGSEKLQPLFVSHHEHPKCFRKKTAEQHGLQYFWNQKAWMSGVIFSRWIQRLDFAMATQKRHILLFLNEVDSHVLSHLELTNITVFLLPMNAAQVLNPFTCSLVATFKKWYRRHHLRHAIDRVEAGKKQDLFDVDILQAMKWAMMSWDEMSKDTIERAWASTHLLASRVPVRADNPLATQEEDSLMDTELSHLLLLLRLNDPMPLSDYLDDDTRFENGLHEEFFEVLDVMEELPDDEVDEDADESTIHGNLSLQDKLKAFRDVLQVLKDREDSDDAAVTALQRVQDAIRSEARKDPNPLLDHDNALAAQYAAAMSANSVNLLAASLQPMPTTGTSVDQTADALMQAQADERADEGALQMVI